LEISLKRKIIGLCGFIGSGKGSVADILVEHCGFTKISYADKVKDSVATIFDWPRHLLEGDTVESREWRDTPDEFWTAELGRTMTPRIAMQTVGTECMRNGFDNEIWALTVKRKLLENPDTNFVIPDIRFFNERKLVRTTGGEVWRIKRGKDPEWLAKAISDNKYDTTWMLDYADIHESEWRWIDDANEFDKIILNDNLLPELTAEVIKTANK
jgi:hypothetical protein